MKRYLLLLTASIAALAVVLPATAGAATFRGAVVAKDSARKALVTASKDGTVRTVRLHTNFNRFRVGSNVAVRGVKLPDGTFSAAAVRRLGKARGTHVRGTVVRQLAGRLVMSAGGSVFALRVAGKQSAAEGGFKPGDKLDCNVHFKGGSPETRKDGVKKVGHDGQLVLEGIYLSTDEDGTIELAVIHNGRVFVNVPDDVDVPVFEAGDEIALVVTVEDDGSFTLVKGESENDPGDRRRRRQGRHRQGAVLGPGSPERDRRRRPLGQGSRTHRAGALHVQGRQHRPERLRGRPVGLRDLQVRRGPLRARLDQAQGRPAAAPGRRQAGRERHDRLARLDAGQRRRRRQRRAGLMRRPGRHGPARLRRGRRGQDVLRQERRRRLRAQGADLRPRLGHARGLVVHRRGHDHRRWTASRSASTSRTATARSPARSSPAPT